MIKEELRTALKQIQEDNKDYFETSIYKDESSYSIFFHCLFSDGFGGNFKIDPPLPNKIEAEIYAAIKRLA